jgi:hypothetical protein
VGLPPRGSRRATGPFRLPPAHKFLRFVSNLLLGYIGKFDLKVWRNPKILKRTLSGSKNHDLAASIFFGAHSFSSIFRSAISKPRCLVP